MIKASGAKSERAFFRNAACVMITPNDDEGLSIEPWRRESNGFVGIPGVSQIHVSNDATPEELGRKVFEGLEVSQSSSP